MRVLGDGFVVSKGSTTKSRLELPGIGEDACPTKQTGQHKPDRWESMHTLNVDFYAGVPWATACTIRIVKTPSSLLTSSSLAMSVLD